MNVARESVPVVLMHGADNRFVVLDERPPRALDYAALARRWCDPAIGFAVDGVLVIASPPVASRALATMRVFNADGSEAEMCGNGARCVGRYLAERGAGERFTLDTLAGPVGIEILARAPEYRVRVDVGVPRAAPSVHALHAAGRDWSYQLVSLGNPHAIVPVDTFAGLDVAACGAAIAAQPDFPGGVNVHFVRFVDAHTLEVRHFERGVGITQACGTGAVASAVAAIARGVCASPVTVLVPGGRLEVELGSSGSATLSGPAEIVAERTLAP